MPTPGELGARLVEFVPELIKGLRSTAAPELAARKAEPHAQFKAALEAKPPKGQVEPGVTLRAPKTPIADEAMREAARATQADIPLTTPKVAMALKRLMLAPFRHVGTLPEDIRAKKIAMNEAVDEATSFAHLTIKHRVLEQFTGTQGEIFDNAHKTSDFLVAADQVATGKAKANDLIQSGDADAGSHVVLAGGKTLDEWTAFLMKTGAEIKANPKSHEIVRAIQQFRQITDETFNDMVDRGLIIPERRRSDYTPHQKIGQIELALESLTGQSGQTKIGSVLPQIFAREGTTGKIETNVYRALADQLAGYYEHVAQGEFAGHMLADPSINNTNAAIKSGVIPAGFTLWTPKQGQAGFGVMAPEAQISNGLMRQLATDSKKYHGSGYVIPEGIAEVLDHVRPEQQGFLERSMYKVGQAYARQLTVYSPPNWFINLVSDLPLAMLGLPGEKARPLGVLRFVLVGPDGKVLPTVRAAWAAAHGRDFKMDVRFRTPEGAQGSQELNVADLARTEGLTTAGEAQAFGGMPGSFDFAAIGDKPKTNLVQGMRQVKNTIEAYPRIAAGLEAFSRTGSVKEFGRVGRNSTLNYGHAAPDFARVPAFRFLAPFTQFFGLASDRVFQLASTKGSQGRTIGMLTVVPTAAALWNVQNEAYRKAEDALHAYDRGALHVIQPDWNDPSVPAVGPDGLPVALRVKTFVTEEVMNQIGLGNIAGRAARVVRGKDTLGQAVGDIPKTAAQNAASQVGVVRTGLELGFRRSLLTGKEATPAEALSRITPVVRGVTDLAKSIRNDHTILEDARQAAGSATGTRVLSVSHKGTRLRDADLVEWGAKLRDARTALRTAQNNRDKVAADAARSDIKEATDNLRRINAAKRKERQ